MLTFAVLSFLLHIRRFPCSSILVKNENNALSFLEMEKEEGGRKGYKTRESV